MGASAKPTVAELGLDVDAQAWRRSGAGPGAIEIAFTVAHDQEWVLFRVAEDPDDRVLVFDRHEWECFLDGAKAGEFDDAVENPTDSGPVAGRPGESGDAAWREIGG